MRASLYVLLFLGTVGIAAADGLSEKDLAAARKLNVAKCSKCHQLYRPENYSEEKWQVWMTKMNRKAKLDKEQAELLARYFAFEREQVRKRSTENAAGQR